MRRFLVVLFAMACLSSLCTPGRDVLSAGERLCSEPLSTAFLAGSGLVCPEPCELWLIHVQGCAEGQANVSLFNHPTLPAPLVLSFILEARSTYDLVLTRGIAFDHALNVVVSGCILGMTVGYDIPE